MTRHTARLFLIGLLLLIPATAYPFGQNKIVYDKFEWRVYQSTHFDIYFYEDERASLQKVVNFAESAYDDLSRKFNFQISKRIPVIFYATHSAFEQTNVMLNFIPEGVGAFAEPVRERMVLPIDLPDEKVLALIRHEMTHIFEYEILFRGKYGREQVARPPTWLMEGLASFMGEDEDTTDRMVLRDAVVNDMIPSVDNPFGGFFAYRFGHAVFSFMESQWGMDGVRDFIFEYRNNLGPSVDKSLKRAFNLNVEEFDARFRTWLRKRYLPALIEKGEPQEFGEPFRIDERGGTRSTETSPAISPSGDLVAALTTYKNDVDVALFNVPKRKLLRNLSKGLPERYEYVIGQFLTTGPVMGRDLAFSPSGDQVAFFVKKERGRNLMIVNALSGRIEKSISMKAEQQLNPAFSPDGRKVAFHAYDGSNADIFVYDLDNGTLTNLTNDAYFDAAPVYSPDGKWIVYSSIVDGYAKLFRLDPAHPEVRQQITTGAWNDIDAAFSPDGKRIFYASDRQTGRSDTKKDDNAAGAKAADAKPDDKSAAVAGGGDAPAAKPSLSEFAAYNIYSLNLENREILQYTDVVGGCSVPQVFIGEGNEERVVFSSYYKNRNRLYVAKTNKPIRVAEKAVVESEPLLPGERTPFVPPVEVALDPEKEQKFVGHKLYIDDVQINAGINTDQTFLSRSIIYMSDMLGNRRFIASLDSVSTFANFDFIYIDQTRRTNWGVRLYDSNEYFVSLDAQTGDLNRRQTYSETGLIGFLSYPFDRYRRIEYGGGYILRNIAYPTFGEINGQPTVAFVDVSDHFPVVFSQISGDNTHFTQFGPISGRRYELTGQYAPDTSGGGTLSADVTLDMRNYLQLSARSLLAARFYGAVSSGNQPNFYYFGGLDTLRGYDYASIVGNRAFYANFEFRFPIVDRFDTAIGLNFSGIRGQLFADIGGAYFKGQPYDFWQDGKLKDGKGSVGFGIMFDFLGLELHFDFARPTTFDGNLGKQQTSFWIGNTF